MGIFHSYLKEGPGIDKNAPKKRGLALFCEIFLREAWSLIELNLIFVLFSLPIVTIGPALGAMTTVSMKMVRDQNSYVWRDFKDAFRGRFGRFFLAGLPGLALAALVALVWMVYLPLAGQGGGYLLLLAAALCLCVLGGLAWIYVYPMAAVTELPLRAVFKNALLLGLGCLKHSLPALLICLVLVGPVILFFPQSVPVGALVSFSVASLVSSFAAWSGIQRYVAQPQPEETEG